MSTDDIPTVDSTASIIGSTTTAANTSSSDMKEAINELLVLIATAFILMMQLGFALIENG